MNADSPIRADPAGSRAPIKSSVLAVVPAIIVSAAALGLGYVAFGALTTLVFTGGFVGGLLLWLVMPARGAWRDIKVPFWIALTLFVLHRVEEKQMGFFTFLSHVTRVPTPQVTSVPVIALVVLSVGAWLLVPILMVRAHPFGRYLAWTFFASMGITELAHFVVFPWLNHTTVAYVPGMWTVLVLAPVAWWGMARLALGTRTTRPTVLRDSASASSDPRRS